MYIEPNTIIKLCSGVPLDNTYQHSIYFNSHAQQQAFFNSKVKKSFLAGSYQRLNKGVMRIEVKADEIYECNYLMYQNTNFGNKWFYAFISSIEYVNNIVSEVKFEIDPLQTYWFDTQFKQCFIERTHVSDDTIGKHILTEPFNVNDYVGDNVQHTRITNDKKIVIALSSDPDESSLLTTYGGLYSGIYSGLFYKAFDANASGVSACNLYLTTLATQGKIDYIVSMFMMPSAFFTNTPTILPISQDFSVTKNYVDLDGYRPKNNKLFTAPYNVLYATNFQGDTSYFKYEDFSTEDCVFNVGGDMNCNPSVYMYPKHYKNVINNVDEKMMLNGFPQCSYSIESFLNYLGTLKATLPIALMGNLLSPAGIQQIGSGKEMSYQGVYDTGAVNSIASAISQGAKESLVPNEVRGNLSGSLMFSLNELDFGFIHKTIRREYAKSIDEYFSMFGYAVNMVEVPNPKVRQNWTYIKTQGCCVQSNAPVDDVNKICSIFDNGITFWADGNRVGQYGDFTNEPV